MVEALERWSMTIAMTVLVTVAWLALHIDAASSARRTPIAEIAAADMPLRGAAERAADLGDPCKLDARAPAEKPASTTASSAPAHSASIAPADPSSASNPTRDPAVARAPIAVPRPSESRVLTLDSILAFPGGSQANICGQAVSVGAPIRGIDMESPPVLAWIDGVRVGVKYKGRDYVLDLDRERQASLDPVAKAAGSHELAAPDRSRGAAAKEKKP